MRRRTEALARENRDVVLRFLSIPPESIPCAVAYIDGLTDRELLSRFVLTPLLQPQEAALRHTPGDLRETLLRRFLAVGEIHETECAEEAIAKLFSGGVLFFAAGLSCAFILRLDGGARRTPDEPMTDRTVTGPRESFVESLSTNIALLRRKLRDPHLTVRALTCGRRSRTETAVVFLSDLALPETVSLVEERIRALDLDAILSAGMLAQLTELSPDSVFPTYRLAERTDIAAAALLEGRVAVLCDQSPMALLLPTVFPELLQAAEDYYEKPQAGTFTRLLRYAALFLSLSLPALYVSLVSFRPEILPYDLLTSIASLRSEVPFPAVAEVLLMEFLISLIIESCLRLPGPLGQSIGVVAGILVGQAIISASLASPMVLIVVSLAAICGFAIPNYSLSLAVRVLRPMMILPAAAFGLFGVSVSWMLLLLHLCALESMGRPYLAPFAPAIPEDQKDAAVRRPLREFLTRPFSIGAQEYVRQKRGRGK